MGRGTEQDVARGPLLRLVLLAVVATLALASCADTSSTGVEARQIDPPSLDRTLPYDDRYNALHEQMKQTCRDEPLDALMDEFNFTRGNVSDLSLAAGAWAIIHVGNEVSSDGALAYFDAAAFGCSTGLLDRPNFEDEFT